MSVIVSTPEEMKDLLMSALDLFPVKEGGPVAPSIFERLHVANWRAYALSYFRRDLTPEEVQGIEAEYACAQPTGRRLDPAELLNVLHSLEYNCLSNGGTQTVQGDEEAARRRLVVSVAFEAMAVGGHWVKLAAFGHMRRPDLERYEITSRSDAVGRDGKVYLIEGRPHPLEGFITDNPVEAFARLWELHDTCIAHWDAEYERSMAQREERLSPR
ncbi:hypothetical protein [Deinococcus xianganensis]|uniref:Uncharacterized protein n=1 Tax=Deinococcus xianganensis TaxID=1507289 RepID=A0A6I4YQQ8_9DEIO|nr:hypothetical protein [Deinococcus xianganensis]MXV21317.1 hypothetical protein [Deinococcus xianganensis]